jgi:hypothetical protein
MTMADSPNTTNLSRRSILGTGIAAAGALAVTAVPAIAASTGSDAKLLQLCRNYLRLEEAHHRSVGAEDDAQEAIWAKEKKAEARRQLKPIPPRPEALAGELDVWPEAAGTLGLVSLDGKDVRKELSELADGSNRLPALFMPRGSVPADVRSVPPPEWARVKARELLTIYDEWAAKGGGEPKPKQRRRSAALIRAERITERISRLQEETANAVSAMPAQTIAGIRAKFAIVAADSDRPNGVDRFGTTYEPLVAVLNSAVRDIERIDISARLNPPIAA